MSNENETQTSAEVTCPRLAREELRRRTRREVAEEIATALEWHEGGMDRDVAAALAREIGTKEAS